MCSNFIKYVRYKWYRKRWKCIRFFTCFLLCGYWYEKYALVLQCFTCLLFLMCKNSSEQPFPTGIHVKPTYICSIDTSKNEQETIFNVSQSSLALCFAAFSTWLTCLGSKLKTLSGIHFWRFISKFS